MADREQERRQFDRYHTNVEVYYEVEYDFETKVEYQRLEMEGGAWESQKRHGKSRNVSAEGLAFNGPEKLEKGRQLRLEVYLPGDDDPIVMTGEVRWSRPDENTQDVSHKYLIGVRVFDVGGRAVAETVHFDNAYKVYWSLVLESILGKFKDIGLRRQEQK